MAQSGYHKQFAKKQPRTIDASAGHTTRACVAPFWCEWITGNELNIDDQMTASRNSWSPVFNMGACLLKGCGQKVGLDVQLSKKEVHFEGRCCPEALTKKREGCGCSLKFL
jgi:hypothetical protein